MTIAPPYEENDNLKVSYAKEKPSVLQSGSPLQSHSLFWLIISLGTNSNEWVTIFGKTRK